MGLMGRFTMIVKAKANKALDKAEDPRETLDYSYEKQLELLQKVRRGVADVATSKKRLELQADEARAERREARRPGARGAPAEPRGPRPRRPRAQEGRPAPARRASTQQREQLQAEQDKLVARRAAPDRQGRGLPDAQGDDQGPVHGRRGPDQDRRGLQRRLRGDGRRRHGDRARREQDRDDARPRRRHRRAARVGRPRPTSATAATPSTASSSSSRLPSGVDAELARLKAELGPARPRAAGQIEDGEQGSDRARSSARASTGSTTRPSRRSDADRRPRPGGGRRRRRGGLPAALTELVDAVTAPGTPLPADELAPLRRHRARGTAPPSPRRASCSRPRG